MADRRYNMQNMACEACRQWEDCILGHCCMCWYVWLDVQRHNTPDAEAEGRYLFFPPELEDQMSAARRQGYTEMAHRQEALHRVVLREQARRDDEQAAREQTRRDEEDTFVLSNWIANIYIYI